MATPYAYPGLFYPSQVYPSQDFPESQPSTGAGDPTFTVEYQFMFLDQDENEVGLAVGVEPQGELKWHATSSIKGSGTMHVRDISQKRDWLNERVKPTRIHTDAMGMTTEYPLGVFLMSAPKEEWDADGRKWSIELLDKNSILDGDIVTDDDGNPVTFSVTAGTNVIDTVRSLIAMTGESSPAISDDAVPLNNDMTWEVGTTILKIINDLLDAANFFSIWCDMEGQYRVEPYVHPSDRPVVYRDGTAFGWNTPFSYGESSLMAPQWTRDRDIFAIPNRWVCITQGDGENEALTATAVIEDPTSPFSFESRGRWITQVQTGVEAVDVGALESIARRALANATSVSVGITASHMFLPDVQVHAVVHFVNGPADNLDMKASVLNTTVPLHPTQLCKTEFREFEGSNTTWGESTE